MRENGEWEDMDPIPGKEAREDRKNGRRGKRGQEEWEEKQERRVRERKGEDSRNSHIRRNYANIFDFLGSYGTSSAINCELKFLNNQ